MPSTGPFKPMAPPPTHDRAVQRLHNNRAKCRPSLVTIPSYIAAMVIMHVYESYAVKVGKRPIIECDHESLPAICVFDMKIKHNLT